MLGRQSPVRGIKIRHVPRGHQERLEQRGLTILVDIGGRIRDHVRQVLSEPGEILFVSALGGSNRHPVRVRERGEKGTARRRALDDRQRPLAGLSDPPPAPPPSRRGRAN